GDFIGRAPLELAAHVDVNALGVLAKDDEVDVFRAAALQRHQAIVQRLHRTDVGVEVEPEAKAEQDVARVVEVRNAGIAERAEEHRPRLVGDAVGNLLRKRGLVAQIALRPQIELPKLDIEPAAFAVRFEDAPRLVNDLGPDPVSGEKRYQL